MRKRYLFCLGLVMMLLLVVGNVGQAQDSLGMHHVATLSYWSSANDIQMVGDLAYVMGGYSGLHIISLADSANPMEVGRYTQHVGGCYGGVYVTGNRAYLSLCDTGVVLDVSDPANLTALGVWDAGSISDISLVHENIAIAKSDEGIPYILDVSDPTNVHYIGEFTEELGPGGALGMAGEYLCMMGWPGGVVVYDISDPTQPQRVAACDTASRAASGTISGNYAYLATGGLHIIDLTNPLQPVLVAECNSDTMSSDVTVTGAHAIVSCGGLHIWNVTDPTHPVFEGAVEYPYPGISHCFWDLSSSGNLVCAQNLGGYTVVSVIDISNPTVPAIVSEFGNYGMLRDVAVNGSIGYISDGGVGLRTINLTDPYHASELGNMYGHLPLSGELCIMGDYAYEAVGYWGLYVIDISNPMQLDSIGCMGQSYYRWFHKILAEGDYLYVFDAGNYNGHSYLRTFNLTNPEAPACIDSLPIILLNETGYIHFGAAASDGYLYLAKGSNFQVFSLVNPVAPQLVGSCNLGAGGWVYDLAAAGHYAYVANGLGGVTIVDVGNPTNPSEINWINGYCVCSVAASGNTVIMDDLTRISIWDVTNPLNPVSVGYYSTAERISDMEIQGQYLFTISSSDFHVYQVDALTGVVSPEEITPLEYNLYPCYPNPFNPNTVIRFSLPYSTHAKLTVYDVTGRRVTVLANELLSAGEHRLTFNASDLTSGVYFVRLKAGTCEQTQKMILLK